MEKEKKLEIELKELETEHKILLSQ